MHLKLEDLEFFINKELKEIFEKNNNITLLNKQKFMNGETTSEEGKLFVKNSEKNIFNCVFEIIPNILIYDKTKKMLLKRGNKSINNCEFFLEDRENHGLENRGPENRGPENYSIFNTQFPFLTSYVDGLNDDILSKLKNIQINKIANYFAILTKFNCVIDNLMKNEDKKNVIEIQQIILNLYLYLFQTTSELNSNLNILIKDLHQNSRDIYSKKLFEDNFPYLKNKEEINLLL